ncbi:MAG: hypothetical protein KC457_21300, partial [Myxococcales bacterium]|nr:hypothetical protein [Myxococcales bacterium]
MAERRVPSLHVCFSIHEGGDQKITLPLKGPLKCADFVISREQAKGRRSREVAIGSGLTQTRRNGLLAGDSGRICPMRSN